MSEGGNLQEACLLPCPREYGGKKKKGGATEKNKLRADAHHKRKPPGGLGRKVHGVGEFYIPRESQSIGRTNQVKAELG